MLAVPGASLAVFQTLPFCGTCSTAHGLGAGAQQGGSVVWFPAPWQLGLVGEKTQARLPSRNTHLLQVSKGHGSGAAGA